MRSIQIKAWSFGFIIALIMTAVCTSTGIKAADFQITGADIFGGTSMLIRTNGTNVSYTSSLSDDKRKLTILIRNAAIKTEKRDFTSTKGIIESAFLQVSKKDVLVSLLLRESAGYTAVLLPYSRSISVDVFKWTNLSASEDHYRSGLIALQTNAVAVAKDHFVLAADARHADAAAFAGFINAQEGNLSEAKDYLLKALERKSGIADVYGGLSRIAREEKNETKARSYENEFIQRAGRPPYFDEEKLKIQKIAPPVAEPVSLAVLLDSSSQKKDTVANPNAQSASNTAANGQNSTDSLIQQFRNLKNSSGTSGITDSSATAKQTPGIFQWLNNALFGIGVALLLVGLLFIRGYFRWKKSQLQYIKAKQNQNSLSRAFGSKLNTAIAATEQQAAAAYQRSGSLIDKVVDDEEAEFEEASLVASAKMERRATQRPQADEATAKSPTAKKEAESSADLFDFDESFYASRESRAPKSPREITPSLRDEDNPIYNTRAEAQLSSSDSLSTDTNANPSIQAGDSPLLDVDSDSLEALAQQLGIDPSLLAGVKKKSAKGQTH